jgi:hypothetical protein
VVDLNCIGIYYSYLSTGVHICTHVHIYTVYTYYILYNIYIYRPNIQQSIMFEKNMTSYFKLCGSLTNCIFFYWEEKQQICNFLSYTGCKGKILCFKKLYHYDVYIIWYLQLFLCSYVYKVNL